MSDIKAILVACPGCGRETPMTIVKLMDRLRPKCSHCRKGITIDRAWMLVEIARLQAQLRRISGE